MMLFEFFKKPVGWLVGALLFAAAAWALFAYITRDARTEARLGKNTAQAAIESGADAVNTVGQQGAAEDAVDLQTKENANEILNAEGASAAVAAPVRDAGLASLCRRAVYRERPECLQFTPAR